MGRHRAWRCQPEILRNSNKCSIILIVAVLAFMILLMSSGLQQSDSRKLGGWVAGSWTGCIQHGVTSTSAVTDRTKNRFCRQTQPIMDIGPGRNKSIFKSQYGQDIWMERNIIRHLKENAMTFVEFGARNGLDHSNTYFFDRQLGYRGILVEASEEDFRQLKSNRGRTGVHVHHVLICPSSQRGLKKVFYSASGGLAGLGRIASENSKQEIDKLIADAKSKNKDFVVSPSELKCLSLSDLLDSSDIKEISLLSIDCEGCELEVIQDFDFKQYPTTILLVERSGDCEYANELMQLVQNKGFKALNWESSDVIFLNHTIASLIF